MQKNKRKIGIDIDGVLCNILSSVVNKLNSEFDLNIKIKDVVEYDFFKIKEATQEQIQYVFDWYMETHISNILTLRKSSTSVTHLYKMYDVTLITARALSSAKQTIKWLTHHGFQWNRLMFVSSKQKAVIGHDFDFIVEDNLQTAIDFVNKGITCYLMDYPYNQSEPIKGIDRVKNWEEVMEKVQQSLITT